MTKILPNLVLVITMLCVSCELAAQGDVALATRTAKLQTLSENLKKRDATDRLQVQEFARRTGVPVRRELPNGKVLELQRVSPGLGPVFYITNNLDAADTVSTLKVRPGGSAGLDLDGGGMIVGEWDGGAIDPTHTDFIGRLTQMDDASIVSGHSTHVAGTLIGAGDGLEPRSRGMAYAAQLNAWDWNSDTAEMALAAAGGLQISNHSYGIAAGWLYIGDAPPSTWWWIGGSAPSDVEDPYFGYYDAESQLWDQIAFDAPYYLIVKASGNDRSDTGPTPGEEYTVIDQDGNPLFTSTLPRDADCAPAGYDCLPTHSVAKNILTVGAVDDVPGGYSALAGPSQVKMAPFSSWGPTDDGRIKPDVVGNGVFLISAWPDSPYYAAAAGTSMAAPNVTGSLLLLQEHYEDIHGAGNFMRSATLKALAIHTADEAGDAAGPDYAFGWGLLNTRNAAKVISEDGGGNH
ncbi:MAG: S8 family serine peptidase, partial [Gammaproteobacteria bacterium]